METLTILIAFVMGSSASTSSFFDGYTDSLGNYVWFETQSDTLFRDRTGKDWYRVSEKRELWQEALVIRQANILAFEALGFDKSQMEKELFLYQESNPLFTKHSHLPYPNPYLIDWKKAINSDNWKRTARKSGLIKIKNRKTGLVLKFYPQKGKMQGIRALGLVKKGFVPHCFEAFGELFEGIWKKISRNKDVHDDPIFDMHLKNSMRVLKKAGVQPAS